MIVSGSSRPLSAGVHRIGEAVGHVYAAHSREPHEPLTRVEPGPVGHLLAVPRFDERVHVRRRGLEMHCTNRCVMRHAETLDQLVTCALEEGAGDWGFCERCTSDLHSAILRRTVNLN